MDGWPSGADRRHHRNRSNSDTFHHHQRTNDNERVAHGILILASVTQKSFRVICMSFACRPTHNTLFLTEIGLSLSFTIYDKSGENDEKNNDFRSMIFLYLFSSILMVRDPISA